MWLAPTRWPQPLDDEAGALDRCEDLRLRLAALERARRSGLVVQVADPAGVACLDRQDRAGRTEDLLRLDVADLAEVGGDAGVLKHLCCCLELRHVGGRALEVEVRLLHRGAA